MIDIPIIVSLSSQNNFINKKKNLRILKSKYNSTNYKAFTICVLVKILFVPGEDYAKECRRPSEPFTDNSSVNKNPKIKVKSLSRPCSPAVLGKLEEGTVLGERKAKKVCWLIVLC